MVFLEVGSVYLDEINNFLNIALEFKNIYIQISSFTIRVQFGAHFENTNFNPMVIKLLWK